MLLQQWETVGGYMLQKNRMGRKIVFFFSNFLTLFFFCCLQRAYETLKQNLVRSKHSSHELRSETILVKLNGIENANLSLFGKKMLFFYNFSWIIVKNVAFQKEFPLSSMRNSKSSSVYVFSFQNMLQKSSFWSWNFLKYST